MSTEKNIKTPDSSQVLPFEMCDGIYKIFGTREASGITKTNKAKRPNGYIYFIKLREFDVYKIGVSSNPSRRLRDINSYLPFDFDILSLSFFNNVYDIEEELSIRLKEFHMKKEWYRLPVEEALEIMTLIHNKEVDINGKVG